MWPMDQLITFHILPEPKLGQVRIIVWDRGIGEAGQLEMKPENWARLRRYLLAGPGFRIREHRP